MDFRSVYGTGAQPVSQEKGGATTGTRAKFFFDVRVEIGIKHKAPFKEILYCPRTELTSYQLAVMMCSDISPSHTQF
ncbi:hypothetical protein C0J52_13165 [Blattella germanica]|nr:hypothetical protein C0J52_13165 [Blattella germanica]